MSIFKILLGIGVIISGYFLYIVLSDTTSIGTISDGIIAISYTYTAMKVGI